MTSGLKSTSICKFRSAFCPETGNSFILLYLKWVFSGYKSLSLNIQDNRCRGLNVSGQTLPQEIFKRFWNNFDFVPPMTYDTKAIIWLISFIANIFEWTENPSLLKVSVLHENGWFYGFHRQVKGRLIFPFNELLDRVKVLYASIAILIYIFQWDNLFQAANTASTELITFWGLHKKQRFRYWE